ncbi:MAG: MFS transporter [Armatimonadetes bacterium]|nr:MFS transporter [Armatimonadota bacterium]MBS1701634.1 MFS transporter [Armatimonadota bacterium]MBS1727301.1 MFS transporter [Armatimonadota bacterium]
MLAGLTKYQRYVLIIAWLGWVFDVMEASLFGLTKQQMLVEMLGKAGYDKIGPYWEGWGHTGMLLGWSLGGLIFGVVADKWGRSRTLVLTIGLYCLFTGLTALCQTPLQVVIARGLTGLGIGGEWAAGAALIAESVPNDFRARAAAFLQTAAAIGSIIGVFVTMSVGNLNWRLVYLAGILPAIVCLIARLKLEPDEPTTQEKRSNPFVELIQTFPYNKNLLLAVIIGVVGITGGGILPFWLPNLVKPIVSAEALPFWRNTSMIALHIGTFAGVLVFPPLTDRFGRRPMFAIFGALSGILLFLTATTAKTLPLIFILAPLTSFFALGLTAGFGLYFTELFAHRFRATGSGISYNSARILSAPIPIWIGVTAKTAGVAAAIGTVASIYFLMLIALIFAPETKGKPLEA